MQGPGAASAREGAAAEEQVAWVAVAEAEAAAWSVAVGAFASAVVAAVATVVVEGAAVAEGAVVAAEDAAEPNAVGSASSDPSWTCVAREKTAEVLHRRGEVA